MPKVARRDISYYNRLIPGYKAQPTRVVYENTGSALVAMVIRHGRTHVMNATTVKAVLAVC
jgi:hypothetical protein